MLGFALTSYSSSSSSHLLTPAEPLVTDEPSQVPEEAPEKSGKEKRKRKKEKERDGSRGEGPEEGLATTAGRAPARGTSQPVTGDKDAGSDIPRVSVFPLSVSFDMTELPGCEGGGATR